MRRLVLIGSAIFALFISLGFAVRAQNQQIQETPTVLCATPLPGAEGTPAIVVTAASPAASPGGVAPGTPVGLFPCPSPTGAGGAAAGGNTIDMVDIAFDPNALTIPANTDVTINLPNLGAAVHNFNIDELSVHSDDVQPGQSTTVTINASAGTYEYYCSIPGHREAGMVGTLTVQ